MNGVVVIAGTTEAKIIINRLVNMKIEVLAAVTSKLGSDWIKDVKGVSIFEGRMTQKNLNNLLVNHHPICVIDASNPFAVNISKNAMEVCKKNGTIYCRFEREKVRIQAEDIIHVKNHEEALEKLLLYHGNIMLTIGSGKIELFTQIPDYQNRVFLRLLPDEKVIAKCVELGFSSKNIIAIRGPFSEELNIQLLKHCNASVLVTKESGNTGGVMEKINAARRLNIPVIIIDRTYIDYKNKVNSIEEMVQFIESIQKPYRSANAKIG